MMIRKYPQFRSSPHAVEGLESVGTVATTQTIANRRYPQFRSSPVVAVTLPRSEASSGLTLHTSTGALSAQSATASGTAAHLTLHEAIGALESGEAYINGVGSGAQIVVEDSPVAGGWAEYERKRKRYERTAEDVQAERERIGVVEPKPKKQARPKVSRPAPKPVSAPETIPQIHGRDLALWIEMLNGDIQDAGGENMPDLAQMVSMRNAARQRQDEEDMAVVITTIAAMV